MCRFTTVTMCYRGGLGRTAGGGGVAFSGVLCNNILTQKEGQGVFTRQSCKFLVWRFLRSQSDGDMFTP